MSGQQTTIETVSAYAIQKGAPFTSREVFDNCDTCDDIQQIYSAVNQLFTRGLLKRRKLTGKPGYEFAWHQVDIDGFDNVVLNDSTASLLGAAVQQPQAEVKQPKPKADSPKPTHANEIDEIVHQVLPELPNDDGEPFDNSITLLPPVWWMCRDGSLRIETGDRLVSIDLGSNDAADLADMIVAVHEGLGIR